MRFVVFDWERVKFRAGDVPEREGKLSLVERIQDLKFVWLARRRMKRRREGVFSCSEICTTDGCLMLVEVKCALNPLRRVWSRALPIP